MKHQPVFLILTLLLLSCGQEAERYSLTPEDTVFENAGVLDVRSGNVDTSHVVIRGHAIRRIIPTGAAVDWEEATVIVAEGNYLLPGLAEMHAHIPALEWNDPLVEETLFLYLSNGITTIRGMLGHPFIFRCVRKRKREKSFPHEFLPPAPR